MMKKHIAVAMGGYSTEFDISIQSGEVVCESLDTEKYNVYPVQIRKDGWFYIAPNGTENPINKSDFSFTSNGETIVPHAVFNTIHGTPGEDGYLQAYLELLGIPQTSTGYYQAALSFNKRDCLSVLKGFGIRCATSVYLNKGDNTDHDAIVDTVGLPCFVKPNRAGSSFGISRVSKKEELASALMKAYEEDDEIIIESEIVGTEVSVGVYTKEGEAVALPATEIVSENDFFDYEAKYLGMSDEITPARISAEETKSVQKEAVRIYELLNMTGVTRSDFIIQNGTPYFIEINTNPGLSKESIVPKQVRAAGMNVTDFFGILVENALHKK